MGAVGLGFRNWLSGIKVLNCSLHITIGRLHLCSPHNAVLSLYEIHYKPEFPYVSILTSTNLDSLSDVPSVQALAPD